MNIAILGYGKEGQSIENYFRNQNAKIEIFDNFKPEDIKTFNLEKYDLIFRSPSVHPRPEIKANWTSSTKYFFDHCPAKIIGVTGTKGKGTTCTLIKSLLDSLGHTTHLVGNIGNPALDSLDKIKSNDAVVFELSSFQLWDLDRSPHIAAILRIEPDHLDVHDNFDDYLKAKSNIVAHQTEEDFCIYFRDNEDSKKIAEKSKAKKLSYPLDDHDEFITGTATPENGIVLDGFLFSFRPILYNIFLKKKLRGKHFIENSEAALLVVAAYENAKNLEDFVRKNEAKIREGLENFTPLPHRLQFIRELNNVEYYDDNYASAFPALDVALSAFNPKFTNIVLIAGGKDRGLDLTKMKQKIFHSTPNLVKVILIGETKQKLAENEPTEKYEFADSLESAVRRAKELAETTPHKIYDDRQLPNTVLMSPGAASFDMFKNFEDRGQKFQAAVKELK